MTDTTAEKLIVASIVDDALAMGYAISVWDGEEFTLHRTTDRTAVFGALRTTGLDRLYFAAAEAGRAAGWVELVWGNEGTTVISDNTDNVATNAILRDATKLAASLASVEYSLPAKWEDWWPSQG